MATLAKKTIIVTGSSRGIGLAIALRCARDGANIVIAAKSEVAHPKLGGSIHETATAVKEAGGNPLPMVVDVRKEDQVQAMVQKAVQTFGGVDALINNAGAINLTNVEDTPSKRYDLMQEVNARAVFVCSQAALPYLKKSANPHILSLSPPINLDPKWFATHAPYTISKYGMTMLSLGMAEEFGKYKIAVNCLWPKTLIATAAIEFAVGSAELLSYCRTPAIMADAAREILLSDKCSLTGQTLLDEEILRCRGYTDFTGYAQSADHADELCKDLFLE